MVSICCPVTRTVLSVFFAKENKDVVSTLRSNTRPDFSTKRLVRHKILCKVRRRIRHKVPAERGGVPKQQVSQHATEDHAAPRIQVRLVVSSQVVGPGRFVTDRLKILDMMGC